MEEEFDLCGDLGSHGEEAVVAAAVLGDEAEGDFLLDEEDGGVQERSEGEDTVEDGRGEVVGEVAADGDGAPLGKVDGHDVGFDQLEGREAGAQGGGEMGIQFDGGQARR